MDVDLKILSGFWAILFLLIFYITGCGKHLIQKWAFNSSLVKSYYIISNESQVFRTSDVDLKT